jgi:hypothetical protein
MRELRVDVPGIDEREGTLLQPDHDLLPQRPADLLVQRHVGGRRQRDHVAERPERIGDETVRRGRDHERQHGDAVARRAQRREFGRLRATHVDAAAPADDRHEYGGDRPEGTSGEIHGRTSWLCSPPSASRTCTRTRGRPRAGTSVPRS